MIIKETTKRRNRIEALKNEDGIWVNDKESLKNMAVGFYRDLLISNESACGNFIPGTFQNVDTGTCANLERELNEEETRVALNGMGASKLQAPMDTKLYFSRWHRA